MKYIATVPLTFSGEDKFIELMGDLVWEEFCDMNSLDTRISVRAAAERLQCLKGYRRPEAKLQAVLKQVEAQYLQNPKDYERPPFLRTSARLQAIIL